MSNWLDQVLVVVKVILLFFSFPVKILSLEVFHDRRSYPFVP